MRQSAALVLAVALAASGCGGGGDDDAAGDAALEQDADLVDAGSPDGLAQITPDPPAKVTMAPCPTGWRELALEGGVSRCEPWPAGGMPTCPFGQSYLPGRSRCDPVASSTCGRGFPLQPVGSPMKYVRPGAGPGQGTEADPYPTIAAATAVATFGTVIALSEHDFVESVTLPAGVTLWGVCERTRIMPAAGKVAITIDGPGVAIRDLSISGTAAHTGIVVRSGAALDLSGVTLFNMKIGITVEPTAQLAARLIILDNLMGDALPAVPNDPSPAPAAALVVRGTATVERALIRASARAVYLPSLGVLTLKDSAITTSGHDVPTASGHHAVDLVSQSIFVAENVAFERNYWRAINAESRASVTLRQTVVREMQLGPPGPNSGPTTTGLTTRGGTIELDRVLVERADNGVRCIDCRLRAAHVAVLDSRAAFEFSGVTATIAGPLLALRAGGLFVSEAEKPADVALSDVTILGRRETFAVAVHGTRSDLFFDRYAKLSIQRLLIEASGSYGLGVFGRGGAASLQDAVIRGSVEPSCVATSCPALAGFGIGIGSYEQAAVEVRRFVIADNLLAGAQIGPDATMDLHQGELSGHPIGANIQNSSFDPARLGDGVLFRDNRVNVDSDTLALPPPPGALP